MPSRAKEDYLKSIYELENQLGVAKTTQLARKLGVKAATVTEMIQRLSKQTPSIIKYQHHQGVHLTPTGKKQALSIIRRHRLLETFLHKTLGLNWDQVHEEAEVLEHHISHRVTKAIDRYLNYPKFDPHGEPIPDDAGNMAFQKKLPLSEIEEGCCFNVIRVNPISGSFLEQIDRYGIGIGTSGRLISKNSSRGQLTVEIDDRQRIRQFRLSSDITDNIYVEKS